MTLFTQQHFAYRHLDGESAAILAPAGNLAPEAFCLCVATHAVVLEGIFALAGFDLGNQQAQVPTNQFRRRIAKHALHCRVESLDQATAGVNGDNAIHHRIENGLHQHIAVSQGALRGILIGDITEHQHGTHHLTIAIANRCTAIGDRTFAPVSGNQDRVIGEALSGAIGQRFRDRHFAGLAGFLIDDAKNPIH